MSAQIRPKKGSKQTHAATWGGSAPMDLTGLTLTAYDVHPTLADHLTVGITSAAAGTFWFRIAWDDSMTTNTVMTFRLRLADAGDEEVDTTEAIAVIFQ